MAHIGDDCFYFLNSGCARGSQCTFRHQPAARDTTIVCPQWLQRSCFNPNCILRHIDDVITRDQTPCFFETNHGGCLKANCPFLHMRKPSNVILPSSVSTSVPPPINLPLSNHSPVVNKTPVVIENKIIPPDVVSVRSVDANNLIPNVSPTSHVASRAPNVIGHNPVMLGQLPSVKMTPVYVPSRPQLQVVPGVNDQVGRPQLMAFPAASNVPIFGNPTANVYPRSEHFNEQVRLFKELLASKSIVGQKKQRDNDSYSADDGKFEEAHKVKERQRSKKEKKEKEVYKSYKSKTSKDGWSKADEEILYGDYKDIPLEKKHKKKKHRQQHPDSDTEVKVKSYEQILREKALRKLFSKRKEKEKFYEDFEELVSDKTCDKMNKKYSSDGDERGRFDDASSDEVFFKKHNYKKEKNRKKSDDVKREKNKKNNDEDFFSFSSESNDSEFVNTSGEDSKPTRTVKDSEKKRRYIENSRVGETICRNNITEIRNSKSEKLSCGKDKSKVENYCYKKRDNCESASNDTKNIDEVKGSSIEEIFADETTSIDFTVDHDDDLAMEINRNELIEASSKPKISSVVNVIKKVSTDGNVSKNKNSYKEKAPQVKQTVSKSAKSRQKVQSSDLRTNERDRRRKSPTGECEIKITNNLQSNKFVKLISTSEKSDKTADSLAPPKNLTESKNVKSNLVVKSSVVKVKSFDEIMAEKRKRKYELSTAIPDNYVSKGLNATLQEKSAQAKLEILDVANGKNGDTQSSMKSDELKGVHHVKSVMNKLKHFSNEEKIKRKSIQLYKPPQPNKVEDGVVENAEVKTVVNTGPRKIIRVRKASLSTDLIDQVPTVDEINETSATSPKKDPVKVRSFEEIIREKRLRQKREKELSRQMKKEKMSSKEIPVTCNSNNSARRKPVIKRTIPASNPPITSTYQLNNTGPTLSSLANTDSHNRSQNASGVSSLANTDSHNQSQNSSGVTHSSMVTHSLGSNSNDMPHRPISASIESQRTLGIEANVAKVLPLRIFQHKKIPESSKNVDSVKVPPARSSEMLENKVLFSSVRNISTKNGSVPVFNSIQKDSEIYPSIDKVRKSSSTSFEDSSVSSSRIATQKITPYYFNSSNQSNGTSHDTQLDGMEPSRKDIQEALDEEKRKREQDLLSDEEFEKEINELCSSNSDDNCEIEDIDEDDLMMELEQMIDG